jgi:hypothetical protein
MKSIVMIAALALTLGACADKSKAPALSAAADRLYIKADVARPSSLPLELPVVASCAFDGLNGGAAAASNAIGDKARVALNGWSGDIKTTVAPGPVLVELDGPVTLYAAASRGVKRPDVATVHNNPVLQDAGWAAGIDLTSAMPGTYKVHVIEGNGAAATTCDPHSELVIEG